MIFIWSRYGILAPIIAVFALYITQFIAKFIDPSLYESGSNFELSEIERRIELLGILIGAALIFGFWLALRAAEESYSNYFFFIPLPLCAVIWMGIGIIRYYERWESFMDWTRLNVSGPIFDVIGDLIKYLF